MNRIKEEVLHLGTCLFTALALLIFSSAAIGQVESMVSAEAAADSRLVDGLKVDEEPKWEGKTESDQLITISTYAFAAQAGIALQDMSTGTTQLVAPSLDDTVSPVTDIGFDFWYDGVRHTQFSVNPNGLVRLGPAGVSTAFNNATGFATVTNAPKIAPFFDDMCVGSDGKVHYKVLGTAPARTLVVEWLNMKVTRNGTCTGVGPGNGTFQMWLHESTGVIEFVYGALPATAAMDNGYTVGLQSGAATNFASVTTLDNSVSYTTHNSTQTNAIVAGTKYSFTPNVPAAPSAMNFTGVGVTSLTVNWTDNATTELIYRLFRSTDGTNFSPVADLPANTVTYTDNFLSPATTYFYQVYAVSEGAVSSPLTASQATLTPASKSSTAAGGNWSDTATWVGGVVPTENDAVTIAGGATVTIDTNAAAYSIAIGSGGVLQFEGVAARTLTIGGSVTNNGIFRSSESGTIVDHSVVIAGSLLGSGAYDFSTNTDTAGATVTFVGPDDSVIGGTGTMDVRGITINKLGGRTTVVELTNNNFTVRGSTTDGPNAGYLTITAGTFKISGTFTADLRTFPAAAFTIPANGGLWLNNPNYSVTGQNGSSTMSGLLRITLGTLNIGTSTGNSMAFTAGSAVTIEGGSVNATGRFGVTSAATAITYSQTGGTVTVQTVGNTSTALAGFDLGTSTASSVTITGGNIIVQNANTAATTPRDYRHQSGSATTTGGTASVTGGTLQLGNAATAAAQSFNIQGVIPNLVLTNNGGSNTATFGSVSNWNNITRNITISTGTTMNFGNQVFLMNGTTLTNNGTLTHTGASSRFIWFLADNPQTYTGTGTVTAPMTSFEAQNGGVILDPAVTNIVVRRVILFVGGITNANKLTIGNGDATVNVMQFGNTTTPTLAGSFDVAPVFNLGAGGQTISYLRSGASRVTGPEINPGRSLVALTYNDNEAGHTLTIAGGDLTVIAAMTLTEGVIDTGANVLIHNGAVTRTNGYVDGNLMRNFTAAGSYVFHVGDNAYSPLTTSVTTLGSNPSSLKVKATDSMLPGLAPAVAVSRQWALTETGDLTADLVFRYDDSDVNGNEGAYKVFKRVGGVTTEVSPSVGNPASNSIGVNGITDFSDWGIGQAIEPPTASASVSGQITDSVGGVGKVAVILSNAAGTVATTLSNQFGNYQFADVPTGDNYTITVSNNRYQFTPTSQTVYLGGNVTGVNFTATAENSGEDSYFSRAPFDFDGDGKTDPSLYRESDNSWYILRSSDGAWKSREFGEPGDTLVPADYDGDGTWDMAVFRPSDGTWYISLSKSGTIHVESFGMLGDIPVASDYDGDGRADLAVFRSGKNVWLVSRSSDGVVVREEFGDLGDGLRPRAADLSGDGRADMALLDTANSRWIIRAEGRDSEDYFGIPGDQCVVGDFDGDSRADLAVFRQAEGAWLIRQSSDRQIVRVELGAFGDAALTGDFDGDGNLEPAVYRSGNWMAKRGGESMFHISFGMSGDLAIPSNHQRK